MERRQHPRSDAAIHVRIDASGMTCQGLVRDISTRGIYVELDEGRIEATTRDVRLYFEIDTGAQVLSRQISGKIARQENDGLAVRFAEHDVLGRAVVQEVLYYMQIYANMGLPAGGDAKDRTPAAALEGRVACMDVSDA